jgi:hypothetical protein
MRTTIVRLMVLGAVAMATGFSQAQAVTVSGRSFSNHSHDQFNDTPPMPHSPYFTSSFNATDGTEYILSPANGLAGSIKTPNGPGASPVGPATTVSGTVTINGSATSAGADLTPGTEDDWLNGNNVPAGVTLTYDVTFTITAANGNNLLTAGGNTGNGLGIANDPAQNYGALETGEVLQISAITTSNHQWAGAPTEPFTFTPGAVGMTQFTSLRSNNFTEASEGMTLSDGTNTWGFGTATGTIGSNLLMENNFQNTFTGAGGDAPLTITTDVGSWNLKGFRLSLPITYDVEPASVVDADFDGDGDVDGADFITWQQNVGLGSGATNEQGDADANGAVDGLDLAAWQANFGPGAAPPVAAIPEPATAVLAATAAIIAVGKRKR